MTAASPARRRLFVVLSTLMAWSPVAPVQADSATFPAATRNLDAAAMTLFDAAEDGRWPQAKEALRHLRTAATAVVGDEQAYVDAGGQLGDFLVARNKLSADLAEAGVALSVRDRRWLVSCAERIAERGGELSVPFVPAADILTPRVMALLFLARSIRRALVWDDTDTLVDARQEFARLWRAMRVELAGKAPAEAKALDDALQKLRTAPSTDAARALYEDVERLRRQVAGQV